MIIKRSFQIMLVFLIFIGASLLIAAGILFVMSPGKIRPVRDRNGAEIAGSIAEKVFVEVNGTKQGMFIRSKNIDNPVLLYLHGGMPDYFLDSKYHSGFEEQFTVVWWEQRGSGMSFSTKIPKESLTNEQLISDVTNVTNYLRKRFGKEKIYLMGHSGGTFTGIQAAARFPELFNAYIGVAQMSYQLKSETIAYVYMLETYKKQSKAGMVKKLESAPVTLANGTPREYLLVRDIGMHDLGIGTMHKMNSVITGIFLPSLACPEYTIMEKVHMWLGKSKSGVSTVWPEMISTDLSQKINELRIPVYFLHGIYDYTCSYELAKSYFEMIKAPLKGFYTFHNSAHSPFFEEQEKTQTIITEDVLKGLNNLADK